MSFLLNQESITSRHNWTPACAGVTKWELLEVLISLIRFVIPGLTRNPVFIWIPAFAGMTAFAMINVAVYNSHKHAGL